MIINYGFSLNGKSHISRGTGCQDAHKIKQLGNRWTIAAVADGVGSATNSHIGSRIACDTVVDFCEQYMPYDYNAISIKSMIRTAFNYAMKMIYQQAESEGEPVESYDTTLSMVIYDGKRIIYGHSGDGAILGLTGYGNYVEITTPQKGMDLISVLPLRSGYTHWVIDEYNEDLTAVLLMTDGILDTVCPYLLKFGEEKIYIPMAMFFGDPCCFGGSTDRQDIEAFLNGEEDYCSDGFYSRLHKALAVRLSDTGKADAICDSIRKNNYPIVLMNSQQDDKTVVGLINTDAVTENQENCYYDEPDWIYLQELWNRKAYPHLYQEEDSEEVAAEELVNEVIEEKPVKEGGLLNKVKRLL